MYLAFASDVLAPNQVTGYALCGHREVQTVVGIVGGTDIAPEW